MPELLLDVFDVFEVLGALHALDALRLLRELFACLALDAACLELVRPAA